jgi:hypothetical protein
MKWKLEIHPEFEKDLQGYDEAVQDNIFAKALFIQEFGPQLGRPHVDTLKASMHANMKELRLDVDDGVWRVAFAFDPERKAVLLVAGDKAGKSQTNFYKKLIKIADKRFNEHLDEMKKDK